MYSPRRRALSTMSGSSLYEEVESHACTGARGDYRPNLGRLVGCRGRHVSGSCLDQRVLVCAEKSGENRSRPRGCKKSRDEKYVSKFYTPPGQSLLQAAVWNVGRKRASRRFPPRRGAPPPHSSNRASALGSRRVENLAFEPRARTARARSRRPGRPRANSSAAPGRRQLTRVPSSEEEALRGNRARRRGVVKRRGRWRRSRRAFSPSS